MTSPPTSPPTTPPPGPPEPPTPAGAPGPPEPAPRPPAAERLRDAYDRRAATDYVFTGIGVNVLLTVVTCGIFGLYLLYRLVQRSRDHLRRRVELLEAAYEQAWALAWAQGRAEELRPSFERTAGYLQALHSSTHDFRDPIAWVLIAFVTNVAPFTSVGSVVAFVLLDGDLVRHDRTEGAIEAELAAIVHHLGAPVAAPDPSRVKGRHNDVGRVVATVLTCGLYSLWWLADMMREGNQHFEAVAPWEDSLVAALVGLARR